MTGNTNESICMYSPTAEGGHPLYVMEITKGLAHQGAGRIGIELVTSTNLDPQFRTDAYPIHAILPQIRHRDKFRTRVGWAWNRATHYPQREMKFLRWLKSRPDIVGVHFQEWSPWLAASLFKRIRRMGKRVFYTVHNVVPHKYPTYAPKWLMNAAIRRASRLADVLFVHTDVLAKELSQFLGGKHPPIRVTPHGVWTVNNPSLLPPIEQRLSWKRLLFFGSIRRNKGLDLLLRAATKLPKDFSITIAGEPWDIDYYRDEITPLVRQLRDGGMTIDLMDCFLPDSEVGPLLSRHSAIVLPYTPEFKAQSGVVFLALAHEMPVVAARVGGLSDLLDEFHIGTMFDNRTPEALAAAVQALYAEGHHEKILSNIHAAKQRYSWNGCADATIAGYEMALRQQPQVQVARVVTNAVIA